MRYSKIGLLLGLGLSAAASAASAQQLTAAAESPAIIIQAAATTPAERAVGAAAAEQVAEQSELATLPSVEEGDDPVAAVGPPTSIVPFFYRVGASTR